MHKNAKEMNPNIWLQSHEKYNILAEFDISNGQFVLFSKNTFSAKTEPKPCGRFSVLSNIFFALYKADHTLFLRIGERAIPLADDVRINITGNVGKRKLCLLYTSPSPRD